MATPVMWISRTEAQPTHDSVQRAAWDYATLRGILESFCKQWLNGLGPYNDLTA